jgi:hypothetical protein
VNRPTARLAILATLLLAAWLSCAGTASSASPTATPAPHSGTIFAVGHDVTVAPDDVANDAVAVGGDVIVAGTLRGSAVAVAGNVVLLPNALVLGNAISIGGRVDRQPGSVVRGHVYSKRFGLAGRAASALLGEPVWHPFRAGTLVGWVASTILYALVAVLCTLFAPRQVTAVRDRVAQHPWASLGWGVLMALVIVPISSVLLLISVIGSPVLIPWLLVVVPVALFFGYTSMGAVLGSRLVGAARAPRQRFLAAAVVGVVLLHCLRLIPYAGIAAWALVWITGFGAATMATWTWWRSRRRTSATTRAASPAKPTAPC